MPSKTSSGTTTPSISNSVSKDSPAGPHFSLILPPTYPLTNEQAHVISIRRTRHRAGRIKPRQPLRSFRRPRLRAVQSLGERPRLLARSRACSARHAEAEDRCPTSCDRQAVGDHRVPTAERCAAAVVRCGGRAEVRAGGVQVPEECLSRPVHARVIRARKREEGGAEDAARRGRRAGDAEEELAAPQCEHLPSVLSS